MAILGDTKAVSLTLLDGVIGNLNPKTTEIYDLGTSSLKWNNVYATNFTGNLTGNVTGNISGSAATISTVGGTTGKFWRGDNSWSAILSDQLTLYNSTEERGNAYSGAIQIREFKQQATNCTLNWYNAPGITFHWGGRWVNKLGIYTDGALFWGSDKVVVNTGTWGISVTGNANTATTANGLASLVTATRANHTGDTGIYVQNTDTTNPLRIGYIIGTSGNGGIWDATHGEWKVQIAPDGTTTFKGNLTGTAGNVAWENVTNKPINFITYTDALNTNGWKTLGGTTEGAKIAISYNNNAANWNSSQYSASLVFGCNDTKGLLDLAYNTPRVTFGGSSTADCTDNGPTWYFKLKGTSEKTYTLPTDSKTLAATDGSNASGTWDISITGNAATASALDYTLKDTTKAYLMASSDAPTSTTTARAAKGDTGVYLTTSAGGLSAVVHSYNVNGDEKAYTIYNNENQSIAFVFI